MTDVLLIIIVLELAAVIDFEEAAMSDVASLKLCQELHKLSGWSDTDCFYEKHDEYETDVVWNKVAYTAEFKRIAEGTPAYSLGYLLRKLPKKKVIRKAIYGLVLTPSTSDGSWIADYLSMVWTAGLPARGRTNWLHNGDRAKLTEADTPEDAACTLCIQLFKQGILTREVA